MALSLRYELVYLIYIVLYLGRQGKIGDNMIDVMQGSVVMMMFVMMIVMFMLVVMVVPFDRLRDPTVLVVMVVCMLRGP